MNMNMMHHLHGRKFLIKVQTDIMLLTGCYRENLWGALPSRLRHCPRLLIVLRQKILLGLQISDLFDMDGNGLAISPHI